MSLRYPKPQSRMRTMGHVHVDAAVSRLDQAGPAVWARFLVDTGALDCLLPASLLERAGIQPQHTSTYELANGELVQFAVAVARLEFMDTYAVCKIIFGPEDDEPILGVIALEFAGITVD